MQPIANALVNHGSKGERAIGIKSRWQRKKEESGLSKILGLSLPSCLNIDFWIVLVHTLRNSFYNRERLTFGVWVGVVTGRFGQGAPSVGLPVSTA